MNTNAAAGTNDPGLHSAPWDAHYATLAGGPPALRYSGGDVPAWQKQGRTQLQAILGMDRMPQTPPTPAPRTLWKRTTELGTIEKIAFEVEPYQTALAYFCLPAKRSDPVPAFVCLQGHSTGMHVSIATSYAEDAPISTEGDRDFGLECMRRGIAALCLEQRSFGQRRENQVGHLDRPYTCHQSAMNALMLGRTLIGERVYDVMRALDYLQTRPEVDRARLGCLGNSGGGTATLFATALDLRIQYALPSCAFSTYEASIMRQDHCVCNYAPGLRAYFDSGDIAGLIAPRPLVLVSGQQDPIFPVEPAKAEFIQTQKIYAAAGAPDQCEHVIGPEGHRFYAAQSWPRMLALMSRR